MKSIHKIIFVFLISFFTSIIAFAQVDMSTFAPKKGKTYIVETNDGNTFSGKILSYDAREILLNTRDRGDMIIPKHQVRAIFEPDKPKFDSSGKIITEERFATRYFITTNGLPIKKGEHYANLSWWGPDFEFAVSDNFGMGVMTTWIGLPIIGTAKYTIPISNNVNLALGGLVGNFTWIDLGTGFVLPYASLTFGNRRSNITFTGGYGSIFVDGESEGGNPLFSIAGMYKFNNKFSFIFDSFIFPDFDDGEFGGALIMPGARWQYSNKGALQFGFAGVRVAGETIPVAIPMIQWFIRIN